MYEYANSHLEWLQLAAFYWLPLLADASVKGFALLLLTGGITLAMRKASAASRQLVWVLAMASLLALPILSVTLPAWQVLPNWLRVQATTPPVSGDSLENVALKSGPTVKVPADKPPDQVDASVADHAGPPPVKAATAPPPPQASYPKDPLKQESLGRQVLPWVLPVWAAGVLASLVPLVLGRLSLRRVERSAQRIASGTWMSLLRRATCQLELTSPVVLLESPRRAMPMVWGLWKVRLLLPAEATAWSADRRYVVLLHELAHAKRHDCLAKLVAHLAAALYWFNPLVWVAAKRMQIEAEAACDDLVLATGSKASDYAQHLLEIASGLRAGMLAAYSSIAMARPSRLENRLLAILDDHRNRRRLTVAGVALAVLLVAGIVLPLSVLHAAASGSKQAKETAQAVGVAPAQSADKPITSPVDETKLPPQQVVGIAPNLLWSSTTWATYLDTAALSMEDIAGRLRIVATEPARMHIWYSKLTAPVDIQRYPVAVMTYRARNTWPDSGYVIWMDDTTGPNYAGLLPFRSKDLIADGAVHELRKDLRELQPKGPITALAVSIHSGPSVPAEFELLGLRFEHADDAVAVEPPKDDRPVSLQVLGSDGKAVEGATVTIDAERSNWARSASTDKNGLVTITPLALANGSSMHMVWVLKPGFLATQEVIQSGATRTKIVLRPAVQCSGIVEDEHGKPVAEAGVFATWRIPPFTRREAHVLTNAQGRWEMLIPADLPPDALTIVVAHSDFLYARVDRLGGNTVPAMSQLLDGTAKFVLRRGAEVSGSVFRPDGTPGEGALVRMRAGEGAFPPPPSARTDSKGRFRLSRVTPGDFALSVELPGCASETKTVPASEILQPVEFHLKLGKPEMMRNWVEKTIAQDHSDITSRYSLEWGDVKVLGNGNLSIRYKYLAIFRNGSGMVIEQEFTFNPAGQFVSVKDISKSPATQPVSSGNVTVLSGRGFRMTTTTGQYVLEAPVFKFSIRTDPKGATQPASRRKTARLVIGPDYVEFQGRRAGMEDLPVLLANVPDRVNTTLEIAAASGTMLIEDFHKVQGQALNLAKSLGYAGTSYVGVQSPIAVATSANGTDKAPAKGRTDRRYFVRLVVGMDRMTFQGRDVTWQELPAILEKLPNRSSTVLELASASGGLTVEHFDAAVAQVNPLVTQHELEYLSFVGTHPLGSKGSAPQELSAEDNKTPATRRAGSKLEFRIALYYAYGSEWEAARKVEYDTWLKRLGQERMPGKGYDWVPLDEKAEKGRIIPGCISAERDGRTYLLVSYTPGQVMLKEDGNAMWGLESVYRTTDAENRPAVGFRFDDRGSELFLDLTKGNLKRNLAIILDGRVLSVGKVMSPIHGEMIIAGQFTQREVDNLIESLRIGMPAVADPATQPGGHGAFGPVTERVVNHTGDSCLIDLESGKVVTPPQEVFQDTSQSIQWTKRNGIDAGGSVAKISPGLIGFDMISIPVSNNLWDTATSKLLMETVSFCQPGNPISLVAKEIPATFIIKTREGGVGVLQITGFTHEPEGVRFRYKLLWKPALDRKPAWQSATQPAATLPSLSELYQDAYNVYILGNVQRPGVYSVPRDRQPPLTLRNLLAVAGAQTETKGLSAQVLRATPDGVNQRFAVDVDDLLAGTVADPPLVENDLVLVQPADRWNPTVRKNPTSADVKITGEVQRPGVYNVDNAKVTLSRMLAGAGFDLAKVQQTRITVLRRKDGNEQTPISVELSGVLSGTVPDFEIVPGDVIVVTLAPLPTTRQGSPATQSAEAGR